MYFVSVTKSQTLGSSVFVIHFSHQDYDNMSEYIYTYTQLKDLSHVVDFASVSC